METDRQYHYTAERLRRVAAREEHAIFKSLKTMPKEFRDRVEGVSFRFEDKPSKGMIENGVKLEALSLIERDAKTITIFLVNVNERYRRLPRDVTPELRKLMLQELADWAGMEIDLGEESS
jgi:hypothetical protein